jgi:hypothetical protein
MEEYSSHPVYNILPENVPTFITDYNYIYYVGEKLNRYRHDILNIGEDEEKDEAWIYNILITLNYIKSENRIPCSMSMNGVTWKSRIINDERLKRGYIEVNY